MSALNHRGLALKLAVESNSATASGEGANYALVDDEGLIDESLLEGVLGLADRFANWLGSDQADGPVPDTGAQTERAEAAPRTFDQGVRDIRDAILGTRPIVGGQIVDTAINRLGALRGRTAADAKDAALREAEAQRNYLGGANAAALNRRDPERERMTITDTVVRATPSRHRRGAGPPPPPHTHPRPR